MDLKSRAGTRGALIRAICRVVASAAMGWRPSPPGSCRQCGGSTASRSAGRRARDLRADQVDVRAAGVLDGPGPHLAKEAVGSRSATDRHVIGSGVLHPEDMDAAAPWQAQLVVLIDAVPQALVSVAATTHAPSFSTMSDMGRGTEAVVATTAPSQLTAAVAGVPEFPFGYASPAFKTGDPRCSRRSRNRQGTGRTAVSEHEGNARQAGLVAADHRDVVTGHEAAVEEIDAGRQDDRRDARVVAPTGGVLVQPGFEADDYAARNARGVHGIRTRDVRDFDRAVSHRHVRRRTIWIDDGDICGVRDRDRRHNPGPGPAAETWRSGGGPTTTCTRHTDRRTSRDLTRQLRLRP